MSNRLAEKSFGWSLQRSLLRPLAKLFQDWRRLLLPILITLFGRVIFLGRLFLYFVELADIVERNISTARLPVLPLSFNYIHKLAARMRPAANMTDRRIRIQKIITAITICLYISMIALQKNLMATSLSLVG
jgi:hypothetical protein